MSRRTSENFGHRAPVTLLASLRSWIDGASVSFSLSLWALAVRENVVRCGAPVRRRRQADKRKRHEKRAYLMRSGMLRRHRHYRRQRRDVRPGGGMTKYLYQNSRACGTRPRLARSCDRAAGPGVLAAGSRGPQRSSHETVTGTKPIGARRWGAQEWPRSPLPLEERRPMRRLSFVPSPAKGARRYARCGWI